MTCHEARELYSALVDDALDAAERGAVEAHVAGCAECRRELERFRGTVALLQGARPVRAPAGFVDRVLEAAAPLPWYRRLARGLFLPLGVKLPLQAAAMLLVGGVAVYVFQHSPELQQAARHEAPPAPPAASTPVPFASRPAPGAPASPPSVSLPPGAGRVSSPENTSAPPAPAVDASKDVAKAQAPGPAQGVAPAPAPAAPAPAAPPASANRARAESARPDGAPADAPAAQTPSAAKKTDEQGRDRAATETTPAESRMAESRTGEVRAKEEERRAKAKGSGTRSERSAESTAPPARDRILPPVASDPPAGERALTLAREDKSGAAPPPAEAPPAGTPPPVAAAPPRAVMKSAPAPASPPAAAGDARLHARPQLRQETSAHAALAPTADVSARLAVSDRETALGALAELLGRAGGREIARRSDGDGDAVDLLVPRDRYPDFLRSLAQVGRLSLEREPAAMPGLVRVILRIVHSGG